MANWKERQHDNDDALATRNAGYVDTLQGCGLLKFFRTPSIISHPHLPEYILQMWNPEQQHFEVAIHVLTIEVEDSYFLIGLSIQGDPIYLTGS